MGLFWYSVAGAMFAFLWLLLALSYWTPGTITLAEGLVTLSFFPIFVLGAYILDRCGGTWAGGGTS